MNNKKQGYFPGINIIKKLKPLFDDGDDKDILDKSSEVNRNLGLFFVVAMLYLLITILGITDLQMIVQDKGVNLPVLNIILPLKTFKYIAPVIILGLHLNVLINILEHSVKLDVWFKKEQSQAFSDHHLLFQQKLHPFLFNYIFISNKSLLLGITKFLVNIVIFFLPMFTLFYTQYHFSRLHNLKLSGFHFGVFILDAISVAYFYPLIFSPEDIRKDKKNFLLNGIVYSKFIFKIFRKKTTGIAIRWTSNRFMDRALYFAHFAAACLYVMIVWLLTNDNKYKTIIAYQRGDSWHIIQQLYSDPQYHAAYDSSFVPGETPIRRTLISIPTLNIQGASLAIYTPSMQDMLISQQEFSNRDSILLEYTKGINLKERDLRMARFVNCEFINAQLDSSKMMYVNIDHCNLANASLEWAQLKYANISGGNIANASFKNAHMEKIFLRPALLNAADFEDAFLQNAEIHFDKSVSEVSFNNSHMEKAKIIGKDITHTICKKMIFTGAHMDSCSVAHLSFDSCNFVSTIFISAAFYQMNFIGCDISSADFTGYKGSFDTIKKNYYWQNH